MWWVLCLQFLLKRTQLDPYVYQAFFNVLAKTQHREKPQFLLYLKKKLGLKLKVGEALI